MQNGGSSKSDVLVIGAGPAGTEAALALADSGANVTLIDRDLSPGGKACGGGLSTTSWPLAGLDPRALPEYSRAYGTLAVKSRFGTVTLCNPEEPSGTARAPVIITVDRIAWIGERLERLKELGVRVQLGERLTGFDKRSATTTRGRYRYGVMIGADGASSRVRRRLGLASGLKLRALQVRVPTHLAREADFHVAEPTVWFDTRRFGSGYAWAFPAANEVRLGCAASAQLRGGTPLKSAFEEWLSAIRINAEGHRLEAGNIGCGYAGHRFGGLYLVGDAAGLASPVTGEGIGQALISGREVAREITDSSYRSPAIAELGAKHRRTHDVLLHRKFVGPLYLTARWLLAVPRIRNAAFNRYIA